MIKQLVNASASNSSKKARRYKSETVALREIRRYQKSTNLLLSKTAFRRLIKKIVYNLRSDLRMQATTLNALQEITEAFLISFLSSKCIILLHYSWSRSTYANSENYSDSLIMTIHEKRKTLQLSDLRMLKQLMRNLNLFSFADSKE